MATQRVVIPYQPRPLQAEIHRHLRRFNCFVCHRRFGKTVFSINELIRTALTSPLENPRTHYLAPLYKQAKRVAWDYAKHYSRPVPGVKINEAELRIDYPNGGRLELLGADDPDSMRGIYSDFTVLDEYGQMSPRVWSEVIRPALADRQGRAIFIGTPMGHNAFYDIYQQADEHDDWYRSMYKASETGILPAGELEAARRTMSEAEYEQEFECSWSAAIRGAYWAKEMQTAEDEGRIGKVPYDQSLPVAASWDLGIKDSTVIWFWQRAGSEVRAIRCWAFQGTGLPDMIRKMNELPYIYDQHIAPPDIQVRELGSGQSRMEIARKLGINFQMSPAMSVQDGIDSVRSLLPRVWFDAENCRQGIEALRQYRTEFDDKKGVFKLRPLHDWCSDYADSARYYAITPPRPHWQAPLDYSELDRVMV